jgi:hypothetical protein
MKIDFKGLLEGATNSLLIKDEVEKVGQERLAICQSCDFCSTNAKKKGYKSWRPDEHCTKCGCNIAMKTRCMGCECPEHFWLMETDEKTDQQIRQLLSEKNNS